MHWNTKLNTIRGWETKQWRKTDYMKSFYIPLWKLFVWAVCVFWFVCLFWQCAFIRYMDWLLVSFSACTPQNNDTERPCNKLEHKKAQVKIRKQSKNTIGGENTQHNTPPFYFILFYYYFFLSLQSGSQKIRKCRQGTLT